MRVRATVAYDGTDYCGFQRQANGSTVQGTLEAALTRVTREKTSIVAAGRTDAGVHAAGQVVAFDTAWGHGLSALQRALNGVLPASVAARGIEEAAPSFHPRFDARSRRYRFTIHNERERDPLARLYSLHVATPLDLVKMRQAAQFLKGEHDFATFGQPPQGSVTVRRVLGIDWGGELPWVTFYIEANAFLYHMVRSIVGTLLWVGRGEMSVDGFRAALMSRDRSRSGPTARAHGLCLMAVTY